MAGCIFDEAVGDSIFSKAGLTVGRMGGSGFDLTISAETRSFSGSVPIMSFDDWESKKEWMVNGGGDRWKVLLRNSLVDSIRQDHMSVEAWRSIVRCS